MMIEKPAGVGLLSLSTSDYEDHHLASATIDINLNAVTGKACFWFESLYLTEEYHTFL